MQALSPARSPYVLSGHGMQLLSSAVPAVRIEARGDRRGGQETCGGTPPSRPERSRDRNGSPLREKVPAGQSRHSVAAVAALAYMPALHCLHRPVPGVGATKPVGHATQAPWAGWEKYPAAQAWQLMVPALGAYQPTGHALQEDCPCAHATTRAVASHGLSAAQESEACAPQGRPGVRLWCSRQRVEERARLSFLLSPGGRPSSPRGTPCTSSSCRSSRYH